MRTYNLSTLPLTKARVLQLANSSYTAQEITYIA